MSNAVTAQRPVAFVTGASRGIGRAIGIELARAGFDIAGNARTYDRSDMSRGLGELAARVEELGGALLPVAGDVSDLALHEGFLSATMARFGRVDVLVNNAGAPARERRDVLETTVESYDRVQGVNARGPFFLTQRFAPALMRQRETNDGSRQAIVFISSISANTSSLNRAEYCVSKAALSQMAMVFAHRLAPVGIRVYDVRPGIIRTDMTAPVAEEYDELIARGLVPQGRWGEPEDVGKAVAALACGALPYATGVAIELSGGMNIRRL